ncbi:MAG TPA: DUF4349 domain-containing protein [Verrucomicrobiae bacterium]|nr:DUF4349 domain-containing protein [Verrucomicrobiae bacterium]
MKRKVFAILLVLLIAFAAGCGAKAGLNTARQSDSVAPAEKSAAGGSADQGKGMNDLVNTTAPGQAPKEKSGDGPGYPRKVIQNLEQVVQVQDVKDSVAKVRAKVETSGGYIAELSQTEADLQQARMTLRVPVQGLGEMSGFLTSLGKVLVDNLHSEDISGTYYDTEARLTNAKTREKRLLELLNQAKNVEDLLKIEGEISRVREQIEQMQGQINRWNQQVDLATIQLTLQTKPQVVGRQKWEPMGIRTALTATRDGFVQTIKFVYHLFSWCLVILGYLAPLLIVLVPGYLIWRARRKKKNQITG